MSFWKTTAAVALGYFVGTLALAAAFVFFRTLALYLN